MTIGRNEPCPCGSGKKYKRCHGLAHPPIVSRVLRDSAPAISPGGVRAPAASPVFTVHGPAASRDEVRAPAASPVFAVYAPAASPDGLLDAARRCLEAGDVAGAESLYRDLVEQQPDHVEASTALGSLLDDLGRVDEAEAVFRRLVDGNAPPASAYCNLGAILFKQGRATEALEALQRAVSMQPNYAIALDNLGATLAMLGRHDEAEQSIRAALAIDERNASAHNNLGTLLMRRHDDAALACFDRALKMDPAFFDAHVQRATLLREQGRIADAVMSWRRAMTLAPATLSVWSNLVHTFLYSDDVSAEDVLVWHRRFDKVVGFTSADAAPATVVEQRPAPAATSRLRVGFLSPDLRRHPVGDFTERLFEHHDRSRMEIVCYHDSVVDDDVGARLAAQVSRWVKTSGLNNQELEARIARDDLDVLIDLAGHTGLRLPLLARRLAPVQVTWLGYPTTTGLSAIAYRLTDACADPPAHDALHSEQLARLPHSYFCYRPRDVAPLPGALPALAREGELTFGSFNKVAKISATTLDMWASVLGAVPASRLVLRAEALAYPSVRERLRAELGARGIDARRIEFREWLTQRHLEGYSEVDIALDTTPHNGATTTCEALWMGVPVVTLAGNRSQARMGVSILTAAGCGEWIATDAAGFVVIARRLAGDLDALQTIRGGLRAKVSTSPLMDGRTFARDFERVLRAIASDGLAVQSAPGA
jgi:predicted O-linked N-acetylglucosamine transferase (SPINDLY family)